MSKVCFQQSMTSLCRLLINRMTDCSDRYVQHVNTFFLLFSCQSKRVLKRLASFQFQWPMNLSRVENKNWSVSYLWCDWSPNQYTAKIYATVHCLIWHCDHRDRRKYLVVWSRYHRAVESALLWSAFLCQHFVLMPNLRDQMQNVWAKCTKPSSDLVFA